jgi:flagellar basal-body rod modification protein FlgD
VQIAPIQSSPASANAAATNTGTAPAQDLNTMFMQLLVAQLKSQSPLDPLDPNQFVAQLAQFNSLSELTQIRQLLQQVLGQ